MKNRNKQHEEMEKSELVQLNKTNKEIDRWTKAFFIGISIFLSFIFLINLPHIYTAILGVSTTDITPAPTVAIPTDEPSLTTDSIIAHVNAERSKNNLPPLTENEKLDNAASAMVDDFIAKNYWNTTTPDGKSYNSFITDAGYNYEYSGADLGKGYSTVENLIEGWMSNQGDKNNILSNNYADIGVSVKNSIVVQMLASVKQTETQSYQPPANTINCTGPDGKNLQTTQQQCDSFNAAWGKSKQNVVIYQNNSSSNSNNQSYQGTYSVPCTTILGPTTIYGSSVDNANANCTSIQQQDQSTYVHCQLSNGDFIMTSQECAQLQAIGKPATTATSQPQQNNNGQLYNQCVSNVQNTYNQAKQTCIVLYGSESSAGPACVQIRAQEEQQALGSCSSQYPH